MQLGAAHRSGAWIDVTEPRIRNWVRQAVRRISRQGPRTVWSALKGWHRLEAWCQHECLNALAIDPAETIDYVLALGLGETTVMAACKRLRWLEFGLGAPVFLDAREKQSKARKRGWVEEVSGKEAAEPVCFQQT